ncbi:MAG: hypothetical protein HY329_24585 [Chloroflexi bacterium]|nr:hypothetical protein [Chloroflexota bacterium]
MSPLLFPWPVTVKYVSEAELRQLFNTHRFYYRLRRGEIQSLLTAEHPASPAAGQPPRTISQMLIYLEKGRPVAEVHQYVRPDGTLGASGMPDPKRVVWNGVLYRLANKRRP